MFMTVGREICRLKHLSNKQNLETEVNKVNVIQNKTNENVLQRHIPKHIQKTKQNKIK